MSDASPAAPAVQPYHRKNPYLAELVRHQSLTKPGSGKDTRHFALNLAGSGITYTPGDSLAVFARNSPALVDEVIALLGFDAGAPVSVKDTLAQTKTVPFRQALLENFILNRATKKILS